MYDNWYVIQVKTGNEEKIKDICQRLISKDVLQECFIPKTKRVRKVRGIFYEREEILFKGYVFMITDAIDDLYQCLKLIPELTKVLGNDGSNILPILKEEVIFLLKFGKQDHIVDMSKGYIIGSKIMILTGPLVGNEGIIRKIDRHKRIAYIEVKLIDQITTVKVGLEIISKSS